ncbi:MAG TPA: chorismate mutase [Micropepsaceae bacterium]|nr:chorismate mutase [Micropepsaceae bacterium]
MSADAKSLDDLRREIDQIDDSLHDLLIRRAAVSLDIAKVKQPANGAALASAMRPAREAAILRRLLARHKGELPPGVVVGIWRQIIAASLRAQAKYEIHVFGGNGQTAFLDLAHTYFGSAAPLRLHSRVSQVVNACAEEPNSLGIVPMPELEEPGAAWWSKLAVSGQVGPRVIAKLPFIVNGEEAVSAYAIGAIEQEASGDDTTLLVLEIASGLSRTKLRSLLKEAGLDANIVAAGRISEKNAPDEILAEVKGFIPKDDPRLKRLAEAAGDAVYRADPIGGFANPVVLAARR